MLNSAASNRWPRELLVFKDSGYTIRFQASLLESPLQDTTFQDTEIETEKELSEIVAETEAKFALHYPHVLSSHRSGNTKLYICFSRT